MKTRTLFLSVAVFILASCNSQIDFYGSESDVFNATVETDVSTKTSLNSAEGGYEVNWSYNDQIKVYCGNSSAIYETKNVSSKVATFAPFSGSLQSGSKYEAFYPATLDRDNLELPSKQTWRRDNTDEYPMYAESSTRDLTFHNLCGILHFRLNLKEVSSFAVSSITVSSTDKGLSGAFHIDGYTAVADNKGTSVTLECPNAVTLYSSSTSDFYIYVPAGEYYPLEVKIVSSEGKEKKYVAESAVTVARSRMTTMRISIDTSSTANGSTEFITVVESDVNFSER